MVLNIVVEVVQLAMGRHPGGGAPDPQTFALLQASLAFDIRFDEPALIGLIKVRQ
ncbi:hypothetical protein R1A27_28910 [Methylobacterium sp. NMS12]|uniref:hypothetical protein n=1 Tax=Methylobacterium sp. NMS12 TaxID=3079766 RepID=UPI003F881C9B